LEIPVSLKYSLWKALDAENERNETIVAVGFRFWLIERLELSLGVSFAGINRPKDILDETYFDPTLSSHHHRRGIGWKIFDNFNIDVGLLYPVLFPIDGRDFKKLNKQFMDIGLGIGYVF